MGAQISIHALLAESDCQWRRSVKLFHQFLSTLSLRRATGPMIKGQVYYINFYPRSPCGERLPSVLHSFRPLQISIHALLAESDIISIVLLLPQTRFLSTLSLRRATFASPFSIFWICHFYPRSPCGERPKSHEYAMKYRPFLSTLSLRRATMFMEVSIMYRIFYPRSPCGERR